MGADQSMVDRYQEERRWEYWRKVEEERERLERQRRKEEEEREYEERERARRLAEEEDQMRRKQYWSKRDFKTTY